MEVREAIKKRQSVRKYTEEKVKPEDLLQILEAGRMAPSGKNCQNWHFVVVENKDLMDRIAKAVLDKNELIAREMEKKNLEKAERFRKFCRNFNLFFLNAPVVILVYAGTYLPSGYEEYKLADWDEKNIQKLFLRDPGMQNIGAAVENMCLAATDLGYGCCWMTGIIYAADEIELVMKEAGFDKEDHFLACMLPIGVPQPDPKSPPRKPMEEICTFFR